MNIAHPLTDNFYALCLAICNDRYDVEKAIGQFSPQVRKSSGRPPTKTWLSDEDTERMIELKETKTYKKIALMFGVTDKIVFSRMKRYKQKRGSA